MPVTESPRRDRFFSDAKNANSVREPLLPSDEFAIRRSIEEAIFGLQDKNLSRRPRTSRRWAEKVNQALLAIDEALEDGHDDAVIRLTEHALDTLGVVMGDINDFVGCFAEIVERLEVLHHQACVSGRINPKALARQLFHYEVEVEWDFFSDAIARYANVLKDEGVTEFRRLVDEAWAETPPVGAGAPCSGRFGRRGRLTRVAERIAELDGDIDRLIAVKARDLALPADWLELATLCRDEGRLEEALTWAERGLEAFTGRPGSALDDFLYEEYERQGRHERAIGLAWGRFRTDPGITTYQRLRAHAVEGGVWPQWRSRALDVLRHQTVASASDSIERRREPSEVWSGSRWFRLAAAPINATIVEVLLWERSFDDAWAEAMVVGCTHQAWLRLAHEREATHPTDAIPIYQREVEELIDQKENHAYEGAVNLLAHVRNLCGRVGWSGSFSAFVNRLRETHKQKRNLMALLDGAGW